MQTTRLNNSMLEELRRILWRQQMLSTQEGMTWLIARAKCRERDVGPDNYKE